MHNHDRKGISLGTILTLTVTACVLLGMGVLLKQLGGDAVFQLPVGELMESVALSAEEHTLEQNIPIQDRQEPETRTEPVPTRPMGGLVKMSFGGSVILETAVRQSGYDKSTKTYDFSDILSALHEEMTGDFAVLTLENLVVPSQKVSDLIAPDEVMNMLVSCGTDMVSFGFPKAYDQSENGLDTTLLSAQGTGLETVGAYRNEGDAAISARVHEVGPVRVAFLYYTQSLSDTGRKTMRNDGRAFAVPLLEQAEQDIRVVRSMGAQLVVVGVHWGSTGATAPTKAQKTLAQELTDAGADLIVGTGSRRVQTIEWLESHHEDGSTSSALCAYSLGCLLSASSKTGALESIILHVTADVDADGKVTLKDVRYTPTFQWKYKAGGQNRYRVLPADQEPPQDMSRDETQKMQKALERIQTLLDQTPATIR